MKGKKWLAIAISAVMTASIACFGLAGCNSTTVSNTSTTATKRAETIQVIDMSGKTITIPGNVKTVATFGAVGVLNAFVECLGCGDLLCNQMPANFTKNDQWAMQYKFAPQIKDAPLMETADGLDMETIMKVKPDVCVTMMKDTAEQLNNASIPCIYLEWNNTEDVKTAVTIMGQVLNAEDRAAEYNKYFDDMVAKASNLTKGISDDKKPSVIYGDVTSLKNPHIISEWWIETAGGNSVTTADHKKSSLEYTKEQLLAWQPQIIFSSTAKVADIYADDTLANIPAVQDKNIYVVPTVAHVWGNRTVEQPLTVMWALNKMYPDIYSEADLSKDIKDFYKMFFEYDMTDDEAKSIIHYKEA